MNFSFEPKLLTVLREGYTKRLFMGDVIAGVIVGIVALPLAIAFAIASGVKPEQGLFTAVVAGFAIGVLGGSRTQISGPTGAFVVIVYGIVEKYGYEGLATATLLAGALLVVMGLAGVGALLKFIPYPVTVGFTSGIALIIFSSQVKDFCGLRMDSVPAEFVAKLSAYATSFHTVDPNAVAVGLGSLAIVFLWPRVTPRIPGSLIAILVATLAVHLLGLPVETIGSRFGAVPSSLPAPRLPALGFEMIREMFSPALTIAFLAGLESLLSAVVADGMLGTRHRSNIELVAQGVGNILSPIFGGIPTTGAIARTATNIKNGGRTPVASIVHSITLLLVMVLFARWAALIPMPTLAAILVFVAYNMSEAHAFVKLFKSPKSDVTVLLVTFLLTVLIDLTVAIQVGVTLAAFLFLQRMASVSEARFLTDALVEEDEKTLDPSRSVDRFAIPPGVDVFEIYGSLFFGAIERFKDAMTRVERRPTVLIIRMRYVVAIDASGLRSLEDVFERTRSEGTALLLCGVRAQTLAALRNAGLYEHIGSANFCEDLSAALRRADEILKRKD